MQRFCVFGFSSRSRWRFAVPIFAVSFLAVCSFVSSSQPALELIKMGVVAGATAIQSQYSNCALLSVIRINARTLTTLERMAQDTQPSCLRALSCLIFGLYLHEHPQA
jgi:hypothetical protein